MDGYNLAFDPLEVKILTVAQDDYASAEAELLSIGFFNCRQIFPVIPGEENILQITDDSIVINYHAAISRNAKLYINGVEKPLAGKISIKRTDSFTVTVVAEDGNTESTHLYKITR